MATVGLIVVLALSAIEAGVGLCADANSLAGFDERDFRTNAEGCADDF